MLVTLQPAITEYTLTYRGCLEKGLFHRKGLQLSLWKNEIMVLAGAAGVGFEVVH